jgi:hypothetical protein
MIFVSNRFQLSRVEPHPAAMGTGLDLDPMVLAAGEIVPVFGTLHVVGLPLRFHGGGVSPLPLLPHQLGIFAGKVFVLIATWLV